MNMPLDLKTIIEKSQTTLWVWDLKSNKIQYSPGYPEILGYKSNEIDDLFKFWEDSIHPEDKEHVIELTKKNINGLQDLYESCHRLKNKSGEYVWIHARGSIVPSAKDNTPRYHVGSFYLADYFDKKKEKEIIEKQREILHAVVATFNHKLNNCLTVITGQLKLIESSLKCSETKSSMCKAFEKIQESVSTLKMMHELLDSESFEFESYSGERNILKLHDK